MEKTQKEIIKEICEEFNCTQKELASKLGFSYGAIRKYVNNENKIPDYFFKSVDFLREIHKLNKELKAKYNKSAT